MKKNSLIKKQILLAMVSMLLCIVTAGGLVFSSPTWSVSATESEEVISEPENAETGENPEGNDTADTDSAERSEEESDTEKVPEEPPKKEEQEEIEPKVAIAIDNPKDWKTKTTKIGITVVDENNSGHFFIKKVEARIGSTGSYTDITDDLYVNISENCTLYVQVTEENGNVTEKSRKFSCFDTDKPSVNAGIEGELLYVEGDDATSGIYAIYVNGSKFTDLKEGRLTINLKDYDSVYEYVTIQAYDHAGNRSNTYKIKNPYYVEPEKRSNKEDQSVSNPTSLNASAPASSKATVTEHTDTSGNTTTGLGIAEAAEEETEEATTSYGNDVGKEFYTITTATDKVFYLIIDKDRSQENVYLLTEVNENDLLNFVNYTGEYVTQGDVPLYTVDPEVAEAEKPDKEVDDTINIPEETEEEVPKETNNTGTLILVVMIAALGGAGYYFYKKKGKKPDYDYETEAEDIDTFEPADDEGEELIFVEEEDAIPADIDESVMEGDDES